MLLPFTVFAKDPFSTSPWQGSLSNTLSSTINTVHQTVYNDFSGTLRYMLTEQMTVLSNIGFVKTFTQDQKLLLKDLFLELNHNDLYIHSQTDIHLRGYVRTFLPTSQKSKNQSQINATKLGFGLSKNIEKLNFGYELSGSTFLHEYQTALNQTSNTAYGMTNTFLAGYALLKNLNLQTAWTLMNFKTYGSSPKSTYSFVQELSYAPLEKMNLAFGFSTGGRQYKNNGKELNLSVFDLDATEVFLGVSYEI